MTVTFSPTLAIAYGGTVSIPISSSGGGGPWPAATFSASGTGIPLVPVAVLSTTPLAFTNQVVGSTSAPLVATLSNTGNGPLT